MNAGEVGCRSTCARPAVVDRIIWGRDREGKYLDRLATRYLIEVADHQRRLAARSFF